MADPVQIMGNIASVIQVCEKLNAICSVYIQNMSDARAQAVRILDIISGLKSVLQCLKHVAERRADEPASRQLFQSMERPLTICLKLLNDIDRELETGKLSVWQSITWARKSQMISRILDTIEKQKATLMLALGTGKIEAILAIQQDVSDLRELHNELHNDHIRFTKQECIFRWLRRTDPSKIHDAARQKRQEGTGKWFTISEEFKSWIERPDTSIWLHGIPGSGKTILCSTIIDYILESICTPESGKYCLFFYFDFHDEYEFYKRILVGSMYRLVQHTTSL